ncbi:MAG: hypothetical protein JSS39_03125 [Nitrospira sp.]|nr:hypothetical protein [Nitrospira sp.]
MAQEEGPPTIMAGSAPLGWSKDTRLRLIRRLLRLSVINCISTIVKRFMFGGSRIFPPMFRRLMPTGRRLEANQGEEITEYSCLIMSIHQYQLPTRRFPMKKMMLSIAAAACVMCLSAYSFAGEMDKMTNEMKGEMKADVDAMKGGMDAMKGKTGAMKGEMKEEMKAKTDSMKASKDAMKDEMKATKDAMKGDMKGVLGY